MDSGRAIELVRSAIDRGVCAPYVAEVVQDDFSISQSELSRRDVLLHLYERRLGSAADRELREATARLVDFLESYNADFLKPFSLQTEVGGYEMFLADAEETEILFWLSMFSRRAAR